MYPETRGQGCCFDIEEVNFLTVLLYIHQNPVKAKIASDVAAYRWSSYSEYTKGEQLVDKEYALNLFSDNPDEAIGRFVQFLRETNSDVCLEIQKKCEYLRQMVRHQFGIDVIEICNEMREKQDHILRAMKGADGVNSRHIAQITRLSPTRVWKV
ncbi:MAG TPA: hypothetical protein PKA10_14975 [Selenomonadales bacterium]|nr:hypothetical protein [Selenomonadales bacterium]